MSVEGDVMRIQKKLSKMSSGDGEVSENLYLRHVFVVALIFRVSTPLLYSSGKCVFELFMFSYCRIRIRCNRTLSPS